MNTPIWKPILILVILALCGLSLYPLERKLKPGLDLAGGTTLIYEVQVPKDADAESVIDDTISVLRDRVDPNGVRNIVWRALAGSRIEIQMAHASEQTHTRRSEYNEAKETLLEANLSRRRVDGALRMDEDRRSDELARIAGESTTRRELLEKLAEAYDAFEVARGPYEQLQRQREDAEAAIAALPADPEDEDATEAQRQTLEQQIKTIQADLTPSTRRFIEARTAYEASHVAVMATNVDQAQFEIVLSLADEPGDDGPSARAEKLQDLMVQHPDRRNQILSVAEAYAKYEKVKGPLDDPNDLIKLLRGSGILGFRIAPAPAPQFKEYDQELKEKGPRTAAKDYRWFKIDDINAFADTGDERAALKADPVRYFQSSRGMIGQAYGDEYYVLLSNQRGARLTQAEPDWELTEVSRTQDDFGYAAVAFRLNATGATLMGNLTSKHIQQPMAILLDNKVMSAPTINDRITSSGIITGGTGGFSEEELNYLIRTLSAGSIQGRLSDEPISKHTISAQFGEDNVRKGLTAAKWALFIVALFMALYYAFSGMVADFALATNMLIILGVMSMLQATFTLPGIAGIVLTIGMAVDANVLIFERIREELERKVDIGIAVRLGFERAFSTIVDANLTTLITCIVLGYTATAEVKGFAVTLGIGIIATLFTALFCSRVIIESYLSLTKASTLRMLPTISLPMMVPAVGRLLSPRIDWVAKRYALFGLSGVLLIAGISCIALRGEEMFDIEFRSGTQVTFGLAKGKTLSIEEVRDRLDEAATATDMDDLAGDAATVVRVGRAETDQSDTFTIATLEKDSSAVERAIAQAFVDVLDIPQPVTFDKAGQGDVAPPIYSAPAYPIKKVTLGDNIKRPLIEEDMADYLGGVAIVLDQMTPPLSIGELRQRIGNMRQQPAYEHLVGRQFDVIGLDQADGEVAQGEPLYASVVIVTRDGETNYVEDPQQFNDRGGLADTEWNLVRDALLRDTTLDSVSNFSPQVSNTMKQQAVVALTLSMLAVVAYIWLRFGSLRYGLAAIAALVHDVMIALGLVAVAGMLVAVNPDSAIAKALMLSDFKVNLAMVAAVLTIVGYSLNDTIVIFDRIRENRGRLASLTHAIVNDSINQTISRTVLTSGTTLLALVVLYLFGGDGVHGFAFTMIVGVFVGTYSSIAIAASLLLIGASQRADKAAKA